MLDELGAPTATTRPATGRAAPSGVTVRALADLHLSATSSTPTEGRRLHPARSDDRDPRRARVGGHGVARSHRRGDDAAVDGAHDRALRHGLFRDRGAGGGRVDRLLVRGEIGSARWGRGCAGVGVATRPRCCRTTGWMYQRLQQSLPMPPASLGSTTRRSTTPGGRGRSRRCLVEGQPRLVELRLGGVHLVLQRRRVQGGECLAAGDRVTDRDLHAGDRPGHRERDRGLRDRLDRAATCIVWVTSWSWATVVRSPPVVPARVHRPVAATSTRARPVERAAAHRDAAGPPEGAGGVRGRGRDRRRSRHSLLNASMGARRGGPGRGVDAERDADPDRDPDGEHRRAERQDRRGCR